MRGRDGDPEQDDDSAVEVFGSIGKDEIYTTSAAETQLAHNSSITGFHRLSTLCSGCLCHTRFSRVSSLLWAEFLLMIDDCNPHDLPAVPSRA